MIYKVAICDDEINQCAVLEKIIIEYFNNRAEKCEVEVWYDSMSLCRDIKEFNPQILFLDIELPGDNGVYAGKYIRETLHNDRMNIVFISHKTSYAMELFQIHPYDFLIKPIDDNVLCDTMTKILQLEDVQKKNSDIHIIRQDILFHMVKLCCFPVEIKLLLYAKPMVKVYLIMENLVILYQIFRFSLSA